MSFHFNSCCDGMTLFLVTTWLFDTTDYLFATSEATATPKRTLTPMTFVTTEPIPTATENNSSAVSFLTSVTMICIYVAFGLVITSVTVIFIVIYRQVKKGQALDAQALPEGLQDTLVDDSIQERVVTI